MSNQSNDRGRAYEYIFINTLSSEINKIRPAEVVHNSSYQAALRSWEHMTEGFQNLLMKSAMAAVGTIFDLEPMILEMSPDILKLSIQADSRGREGDVRDIVISRSDVQWEIGLSLKHNHFAVKHSRLAKSLDFGAKWFGIPCSEQYWHEVKPIFDYLREQKAEHKKWAELPSKEQTVYVPLLRAFINEVLRSNAKDPSVPQKMVEYLLGEFDFYKVISIDRKQITQIQSFNLHGTLNQPSENGFPKSTMERTLLPTKIVSFDFKTDSTTTVELYLDGGWQFSFRIHNASTKVETSLKFDIEIMKDPTTIAYIDCPWR